MWDNISLALQSLRSNKMRALLTMLGIIIGIGAVIAIQTVGNSLTSSLTDSMSGFGISNISLSLTQKDSDSDSDTTGTTTGGTRVRMFMDSTPGDDDLITDEMIAEFRSAFPDEVAEVELTQSLGTGTHTDASDASSTTSVNAIGVNDDYFAAEGIEPLYGRLLSEAQDSGKMLCMVSDRFVEDTLACTPLAAVGKSIDVTINNTPYTFYIAGVYHYDEDDDSSLMMISSSDDVTTSLYLLLSTAKALAGSADGYQSITVICSAETDTAAFLAITEAYFETFYTRNDTWTVEASSLESLISTMTDMLNTVSLAIAAIAAISLLVGGIGVMNIMLVSITERTREIGTRKALGAPQSAIRVQFIVESVVICLVGGVIGIVLGCLLGSFASGLLGFPAQPDVGTILIAVGFSMAIGVFFGYYPANKAAKLDPIEALRYE